jgi:hypothetical protein
MDLTSFSQTVPTPGTPVALSATTLKVRRFWLMAKKVTGVNAGNVFVGDSTVDYVTAQQLLLAPGTYWEPPWPDHGRVDTFLDLANVYIDAATAGDGVVGGYLPA